MFRHARKCSSSDCNNFRRWRNLQYNNKNSARLAISDSNLVYPYCFPQSLAVYKQLFPERFAIFRSGPSCISNISLYGQDVELCRAWPVSKHYVALSRLFGESPWFLVTPWEVGGLDYVLSYLRSYMQTRHRICR